MIAHSASFLLFSRTYPFNGFGISISLFKLSFLPLWLCAEKNRPAAVDFITLFLDFKGLVSCLNPEKYN
jgi:hypothetical protein